jgi:hypothetical protein
LYFSNNQYFDFLEWTHSYNEKIISEAKNHDNSCADLRTFISLSKSLKSGKNASILSSFRLRKKSIKATFNQNRTIKISRIYNINEHLVTAQE